MTQFNEIGLQWRLDFEPMTRTLWSRLSMISDFLDIRDMGTTGSNSDKIMLAHFDDDDSRIETVLGTFTVLHHIASGANGIVGKVKGSDGRPYILKRIDCRRPTDAETKYVQHNFVIETVLQHLVWLQNADACPRIISVGRAASGAPIGFVLMECIDGMDVQAHVFGQPTVDAQFEAVKESMIGLARILVPLYASCSFNHGDMKPNNLFRRADGSFMLIDFGFSTFMVDNMPAKLINANSWGDRVHPSHDLTMMACFYNNYLSAVTLEYPPMRAALDAMLLNATCDTSRPVPRGTLTEHAAHILEVGRLNQGQPLAQIYATMAQCCNLGCMPGAVVNAFTVVGGGARRTRRTRRTRRKTQKRKRNA